MRGVVLLHRGGVGSLLRQDRARDRAEREQEQQDQRGPHGGELPPAPAQPAGAGLRRRRGPAGTAIRRARFLRAAERFRGFVFPRYGLWLGLGGVYRHLVPAASLISVVSCP